MKDYMKDSSVPLPIASLLNAAQASPPEPITDLLSDIDRLNKLELSGTILQGDLADMCRAVDLPAAPRPQSPHEVFRECIGKVERLQFDLKAARHEIECADEQIRSRSELFRQIADIAEASQTLAAPADSLPHIARLARAASKG